MKWSKERIKKFEEKLRGMTNEEFDKLTSKRSWSSSYTPPVISINPSLKEQANEKVTKGDANEN